ncbi:MAG: phosphoribosylanthranilate isomerase [Planctomycetes bacterium]|nr:phosphoribosylanthranilate isomerase [Planctomycetota bacterium]
MRVKICGITNQRDANAAARCGADLIGLIRAASPRQVELQVARQIVRDLSDATGSVLLFRDAPLEEVTAELQATAVPWVQLHGRESAEYVLGLARRCPAVRIIKAWEITPQTSLAELLAYVAEVATSGGRLDVVIVDAPKGGPHPGFERMAAIAHAWRGQPLPELWLAGGLTPENLSAAVAAGQYDGVDVASGVESEPGTKDHDAVRRFVELARRL